MKKNFQSLMHLGLCALLAVFVVSCSSDDDSLDVGNNSGNAKLAGTAWTTTNRDYGLGDDWASTHDERYSLYFHSDTEGILYHTRKDSYSDMGTTSVREAAHFTYALNGNVIALDYITDPLFSLNKLTLNGNIISANGLTYTRSALSADDKTWIETVKGTTGSCNWYSNVKNAIWIAGEGSMANYTSFSKTPWAKNGRYPNTVKIKDGVTSVGAYAFANPSISAVELPSSLNMIGSRAFSGASISRINLPDNIRLISEGAFSGCSYLANVYLPSNVEVIEEDAFEDCKSVSMYDTKRLRSIGNWAFGSCEVTRWTDSEVLEEVGAQAFGELSVSELRLPNSLKEIGGWAFNGDDIRTIRIGSGLTTITGNGSPFCVSSSSRGKMYVDKNVPLELDREIISDGTGSYNNKWTLYVPKGCKSAYSKAPYWRSFASIVEDASLSGDGSIVEDEDEGGEDDNQSREYVDLGLPSGTLWATRNVGAASPADYGDYFAWGETSPKTDYDWDTYKWCNGSSTTLTKYNTKSSYGTVDNKKVLASSDDAATANWGGAWRMPTTEEQEELDNTAYCTWTWTTRTNSAGITINGYEVKSKSNGNSIFLPAAGCRYDTSLGNAGSYGYYWSSSLNSGGPNGAYDLYFYSVYHYWYDYGTRYFGRSVRPVRASARN